MVSEEEVPFTQVDKLVYAVQFGNFSFVESAVTMYHVSPDTKDAQNCSLLHWAAINNRVQIAAFLLSNHANVNIVGGEGEEVPLQWAVRYAQCLPMVGLLLQHKADVHHRSLGGYDSLYLAVMAGYVHNVFLLLTAGGASPNNSIAADGDNPLHWILKHRNLYDNHEAKDILRMLLASGADVRALDIHGDTPLISLATSAVTKKPFPSEIAFLLHAADPQPESVVFQVTNTQGDSAWVVAWKTQNLWMLRDLWDLYLYHKLPNLTPTVVRALLFLVFFYLLQTLGYFFGPLWWGIIFFGSMFVDQGSIETVDGSRSLCGTSWGIIILAGSMYFIYLQHYFSWWLHLLHCAVLFSIVMTLWMSMRTSPMVAECLGRKCRPTHCASTPTTEQDQHKRMEYWQSLVPKLLQAPPIFNTRNEIVGSSFRLCTTCLVEKSENTIHCKSCNACVVGLDHHCPFVNNCVGRGNRRVFVWFTFLASFGCLLMASWSWYVQTEEFCNASASQRFIQRHQLLKFLLCQWAILWYHPEYRALFWITYIAASAAVAIGLLFISQVYMVTQETTTFASMKQRHSHPPKPPKLEANSGKRNLSQSHPQDEKKQSMDWKRSWTNLRLFCQTGQFRVSETVMTIEDECCDDHHHSNSNGRRSNGSDENETQLWDPMCCRTCAESVSITVAASPDTAMVYIDAVAVSVRQGLARAISGGGRKTSKKQISSLLGPSAVDKDGSV